MKTFSHAKRRLFLVAALTILAADPSAAVKYSTDGLYEAEHLTLPNGFQMVLKQRPHAPNVSIRVVVDMGLFDFPCGRREVPHLLEHLIFTTASESADTELWQVVNGHGGLTNATTSGDKTTYSVDIYSGFAGLGVDYLFEILTDSQISSEDVEQSRDIIHREAGGLPSPLYRWLYARGLGKRANLKGREALGFVCAEYETAVDITRDDILSAFLRGYVPNNMTLVIVGDFERDAVLEQVRASFGTLPRWPIHIEVPWRIPLGTERRVFTSTLMPVLGHASDVSIAYPTGGYRDPDYYPLFVLSQYLESRLYQELRIESGLSYSTGSYHTAFRDRGYFIVGADTDPKDRESVLNQQRHEIRLVADGKIDVEALDGAREAILLGWAQGFEANAEFADFYVESLFELADHGGFVDAGSRIEAVTAEDVRAAAGRLFNERGPIEMIEQATMKYETAGLSGAGLVAAALVLGVWLRRGRRGGSA